MQAVTQSAECAVDEGAHCPLFHSCQTCSVQPQCLWTDLDNCNSTVDTPQVNNFKILIIMVINS